MQGESMRPVGKVRRKEFGFIRAPLREVLDYLEESNRLTSLYSTGVARLQGAHNLAVALDNLRDKLDDEDGDEGDAEEREARLAMEKDLGELARQEVASGFRLLSAHAILGAWGVLESAIDDWVVQWITRRPQDLDLADDVELKLPAVSYVSLSAQERAEILFTALRKRQGQSFGTGIARFERPLAVIGLAAPVPDFISDVIFEMHRVRNVYAHCGGRADDKFLSDCPWFNLAPGDIVPVNNSILRGYTSVLSLYMLLLLYRAYARVGIRLVGEKLQQHWDKELDVVAVSEEAAADYCATLPPCLGSVPIIKARYGHLVETSDENVIC